VHAFDDPAQILAETRLIERFLNYVRVDTTSDEACTTCPSTRGQLELAQRLREELAELGLPRVEVDENGYLLAEFPGNAPGVVGLCAHLDTSPAFPGAGIEPRLHQDYDGGPIELAGGVVLDPADCPELADCRGDTLVTSDGTTLLGADDKAGIASIVALVELLLAHPEIQRPDIRIAFTPDEEVGRGAHRFPLEAFDAPVAFTVDGGFAGELSTETFSADKAVVCFEGVSVHPGWAKGKLVNALTALGKFLARLPLAESPECTEGREGFFHATDVSGNAASARVQVILRDFDDEILARRGTRLCAIAEALEAEHPGLGVSVEITPQYRNMAGALVERPEITVHLRRAVELAGIEPQLVPVRGGTDGSQLTAMGLPTPNIFTGGGNFHGPREWVSTRGMALATCTLANLVQLYAR